MEEQDKGENRRECRGEQGNIGKVDHNFEVIVRTLRIPKA